MENGEKSAKLPVGPTPPIPGPTLLIVVRTDVNVVPKSILLMEINIVATRIKEVKNVLDTADILDNVENDSNVITIGSKFTVDTDSVKNLTFTLVEIGGDPLEGLVSLDSPIGAAVINKSVGESFSYLTPSQQQINGCIKAILTLEDNIDDKKQYVATKK